MTARTRPPLSTNVSQPLDWDSPWVAPEFRVGSEWDHGARSQRTRYGRTPSGRIDRTDAPPETLEIDIPEFVEGNVDDLHRGSMMTDADTGELFEF